MSENDITSNRTASSLSEPLSALYDGECSELELRRVLKQIDDEASLLGVTESLSGLRKIARVSDAIKGDVTPLFNMDISGRVSEVIANEPDVKGKETKRFTGWFEGLAKTGIAAAVAVGVLVGVQNYSGQDDLIGGPDLADRPAELLQPQNFAGEAPEWFPSETLAARAASVNSTTNPVSPSPVYAPSVNKKTVGRASAASGSDPRASAYFEQIRQAHAQNSAYVNAVKVVPLTRASKRDVLGAKNAETNTNTANTETNAAKATQNSGSNIQ